MDTLDLNRCLEGHPDTAPYFEGTFPCDQLPHPKAFPSAMIANLDDSSQPGSHWVALFFQNANKVYYFDPFGEPPPPGPLSAYLSQFGKVIRNRCIFQPNDSIACGAFTVFLIYHLCIGKRFDEVLSILCKSHDPDRLVRAFVHSCF